MALKYNPPPGWKVPLGPDGSPTDGFSPDPSWPAPPEDWQFWVLDDPEPLKAFDAEEIIEEKEITSLSYQPAPRENSAEKFVSEELLVLDDQILLQRAGIYDYHHPLENSPQYEQALEAVREDLKNLLKNDQAILVSDAFSFEGSFSKGQKLVKDLAHLCIRAFNSEVDISMRTMKAGSLELAKGRLSKSKTAIERFGSTMGLRISDDYYSARMRELELVSDLLHKKQEEKEAEREEKARLREEARVQRELEEKGKELRKEKERLLSVRTKLLEDGRTEEAAQMQSDIEGLEKSIEDNDYRAANIRAGYVYVISNVGSFGRDVVKIGLTRRLEPEERIKELSDASVPFIFDKHIIYFSEDAVSLENELHQKFADKRVNLANLRKEFFYVSPSEVQSALEEKVGTLLEFVKTPAAEEFLQSESARTP